MFSLITILFSLFGASKFDIGYVYFELSMDTYKHGMDASPLVKTTGNSHPRIDSLSGDTLYGRVGKRVVKWNKKGECSSPLCKPSDDLTWSDMWLDKP